MDEPTSSSHKRRRSRSPEKRRKHKTRDSRSSEREGDDKHRRRKERGEEELKDREARKREKRARKEGKRSGKGKEGKGMEVVDDDEEDDWVEKDVDGEIAISNIPSSTTDYPLHTTPSSRPLPPSTTFSSSSAPDRKREDWMLDSSAPLPGMSSIVDDSAPHSARVGGDVGPAVKAAAGKEGGSGLTDGYGEEGGRAPGGEVDFFSSLGKERAVKERLMKPDPSKLQIFKGELNTQLIEGKALEDYEPTPEKKIVPGSAGAQWRMGKLKRVYEQAEEESRSVEEVAIERYGNLEDFHSALAERRILDERDSRRSGRRGNGPAGGRSGSFMSHSGGSGYNTPGNQSDGGTPGPQGQGASQRRYVFTTEEGQGSRPSSRAGFRRPGEAEGDGAAPEGGGMVRSGSSASLSGVGMSTPVPAGRSRFDSKPSTPIPSVLTPHHLLQRNPLSTTTIPTSDSSSPPLTSSALNKLQARVLRARLMEDPAADELEKEYERESERARTSGAAQAPVQAEGQKGGTEVQVMPTLDGRGRLYDVGTDSGSGGFKALPPGNRQPNTKKFETRDKTGELLRYNADDDTTTLGELVRQERFGAGSSDQKDLDGELAAAIMADGKFNNDLDYMDDNVEKLARKKVKSDAMKKAFAVGDYAKTKKALDTCPFCSQDDGPPKAAIVALGTRVYLACTQTEELVDGHCLIVPIQHTLSTLDLEDDDWEEIRNFMKCLMQMFASQNKGVIFFETVLTLKSQKHTYIECLPIPSANFPTLPAFFRESLLASESEWSQHKKVIDFSSRPGGFRRAMVSNLPYFMVMWDYRGDKGYGHVIEGMGDAPGGGEEDEGNLDEGDKGGGEFPRYFAQEIVGGILGLEPRRWRKPRWADGRKSKERAGKLGNAFQKWNWTLQLGEGS